MSADDKGFTNANLSEIESKLIEAEKYKAAGNAFYKNGDYKKAAGQYHRCVLYMKGIDNDLFGTPDFLKSVSVHPEDKKKKIPEDLERRCIQMNVSVYNNLAASLLKVQDSDPSKIVHYADIVLEIEPMNSKALFRKAQAEFRSKNYESAARSLRQISIPDKNVCELLKQVNSALKEESQSQKDMYRNMFK